MNLQVYIRANSFLHIFFLGLSLLHLLIVLMIDSSVLVLTYFDPSLLSFSHFQECTPQKVKIPWIIHYEFICNFPSLIEIYELTIIKSCGMSIIDSVCSIYEISYPFSFHKNLYWTIFYNILYSYGIYIVHVVKFIVRAFWSEWELLLRFSIFSR